jgi:hypothetical protein
MNIPGSYGHATFIAKISSAGTWQLVKELCNSSTNGVPDGDGNKNPERLTVDNNNNIYASVQATTDGTSPEVILGDTTGRLSSSSYIVKMTNNGNLI